MRTKLTCLCLVAILTTSCGALTCLLSKSKDDISFQVPIMVWSNEYVLEKPALRSSGIFCEWPETKCNVLHADAQYEVVTGKWTNAALVTVRKDFSIESDKPKIVPYDASTDECKTRFAGEICSPNYVLRVNAKVNDPLLKDQWWYPAVRAARGLSLTHNAPGPLVAVLDTGVMASHEDLDGQVVKCFNAIIDKEEPCGDPNTHGTMAASVIAAKRNNAKGVVGICPNCKLLGIKFLGASGSGSLFHAIKGIDYAIQNGARIINASFGGGGYSEPFYQAIQRANQAGVLLVAAAGNSGSNNDYAPHYPSSYEVDNVVSVAATTEKNRLSEFSCYGAKSVDLAAPGSDILMARNDGGYGRASGTSFSAPAVAGVAGLLLSKYPNLTISEVKQRLFSGVRKLKRLKGKMLHNGVVNAYRSLK